MMVSSTVTPRLAKAIAGCHCCCLQEEWIGTGLHQDLQVFSQIHSARLQRAGLSYEDLIHAMGLVSRDAS